MTTEELKQSEANAFDLYFAAALKGLCSNPHEYFVALDHDEVVNTAASLAKKAIAVRIVSAEKRDRFYEEFPKGYQE